MQDDNVVLLRHSQETKSQALKCKTFGLSITNNLGSEALDLYKVYELDQSSDCIHTDSISQSPLLTHKLKLLHKEERVGSIYPKSMSSKVCT